MKTSRHPQVIVLLLAGLLAGCSASGGESGAGRDPGPPQSGTEPDDLALPIDSYGYTAVEVGQIVLAREILTTACLRRLGLPNVKEPDRAALDQVTKNRLLDLGLRGNNRRYGVTDTEVARINGYHLPSTVSGSTAMSDIDSKNAESRPGSQDRCLDEADRAIAGKGSLGNNDLVRKIAWDSYEKSLHSPRVTEALNRWSSCMATKGYSYTTPPDAESAFDLTTAVVTPEEIAAAVADASCKQETGLIDVWQDVEEDYQSIEITNNVRELDAAKALHDQCMKRVSDVITERP